MSLYIVRPPGIVYSNETPEQAAERDRQIAEHNARIDREETYARAPMKALWPWCRQHAPWLLPEEEQKR